MLLVIMDTRTEEADIIDSVSLLVGICHWVIVTFHSGTKIELNESVTTVTIV